MHYKTHSEAMSNFYRLQVGDTCNSGKFCEGCGIELLEVYTASAILYRLVHNTKQCLANLLKRVQTLEANYDYTRMKT